MPDNTVTAGPVGRPGPPGTAVTVVPADKARQGGPAWWDPAASAAAGTVDVVVTVPPVILLSIYLIFRGGNLRASVGRFWYMPVCMIGGALVVRG
jgi:hypothetical protein